MSHYRIEFVTTDYLSIRADSQESAERQMHARVAERNAQHTHGETTAATVALVAAPPPVPEPPPVLDFVQAKARDLAQQPAPEPTVEAPHVDAPGLDPAVPEPHPAPKHKGSHRRSR